MQSVKSQVQILQDVKENQATLSSGTFFFGPPPETGASEDITYPYTGSWLNSSQLNGSMLSTSFKLFFADKVHEDQSNRTEVLSSLQISAIQFLAQLEHTLKYSYNARLVQNKALEDFEGKWNDFVTGWECDVTIEQFYNKSVCDIPSSGNDAGKVIIKDQYGTTWYTLNPNTVLILNNLTFTEESYTITGTNPTQSLLQTPVAIMSIAMNGSEWTNGVDYTLSGNTLTILGTWSGDKLVIKYAY